MLSRSIAGALAGLASMMMVGESAFAQTVVTGCGSTWAGDLILDADLDCTGTPAPAITLGDGATLDLAGFSVIAGLANGVSCVDDCTIDGGGGTITGGTPAGIVAPYGELVVSNVTVTANAEYGIYGHPRGEIVATNVTASNHPRAGISGRRVTATSCNVIDNEGGGAAIYGSNRVIASDVYASGNRGGFEGRRLEITGSTIIGNEFGAYAYKRLEISGSTVIDNERGGIWGARITAADSTFANNDVDVANCSVIPEECADLASYVRPRLSNVTCELSLHAPRTEGEYESWGVCAND